MKKPPRDPRTFRPKASYSSGEYSTLKANAAMCGMTTARYIRETSLSYRPDPIAQPANDEAVLQLGGACTNLNQLTHSAHINQLDAPGINAAVQEIRDIIKKL